jgi:DNA polymerase-3 subunit epsilon
MMTGWRSSHDTRGGTKEATQPGVAETQAAPFPSGPVTDAHFAVVDVETNGLSPYRHRLLQVGIVRLTGHGVVLDRWDTLLRAPWRPLGPKRIHGLSRRRLRGAPRFRTVVPELVAALDGCILCAHNTAFDWPFLVLALQRDGYPAPDALRLCTLELSRSLDPERLRSHRLSDLCQRYGVALDRAHDAAADAAATSAVLPFLLAEAGITELAGLSAHLAGTTTSWPTPRPLGRHRGQL